MRVKASAGITEGQAGGIVQSDADTSFEEAVVAIQSGFETACSFRVDALFPKEVDIGV